MFRGMCIIIVISSEKRSARTLEISCVFFTSLMLIFPLQANLVLEKDTAPQTGTEKLATCLGDYAGTLVPTTPTKYRQSLLARAKANRLAVPLPPSFVRSFFFPLLVTCTCSA